MEKEYDVVIVGGGVIGSALLYTISSFTDIKSVLLLEKYGDLATLNSNSNSNSQTLHWGDVETNYTIEKAKRARDASRRLLGFASKLGKEERDYIVQKCQKMVLATNEREVELLERTYSDAFRELFPGAKFIGRGELARVEPNTMKGRDPDDKVAAILSDSGYMVDFGALAHAMVKRAQAVGGKTVDVLFNSEVLSVETGSGGSVVRTRNDTYRAGFVDIAAGMHTLVFAKAAGYAKDMAALAVGGNFYTSRRVLNGKVYRVQIGGIPFVAVHGDPDIRNKGITRFGPTVSLAARLERYTPGTRSAFMKALSPSIQTFAGMNRAFVKDKDMWRIMKDNALYLTPLIGKRAFLEREVRRIVPSMGIDDIKFGKGIGGVRMQAIDVKKRGLILGEMQIIGRENIIFNLTPSPGATMCLTMAVEDAKRIASALGREFHADRCAAELGVPA